jgi:hypothetical protein
MLHDTIEVISQNILDDRMEQVETPFPLEYSDYLQILFASVYYNFSSNLTFFFSSKSEHKITPNVHYW